MFVQHKIFPKYYENSLQREHSLFPPQRSLGGSKNKKRENLEEKLNSKEEGETQRVFPKELSPK